MDTTIEEHMARAAGVPKINDWIHFVFQIDEGNGQPQGLVRDEDRRANRLKGLAIIRDMIAARARVSADRTLALLRP